MLETVWYKWACNIGGSRWTTTENKTERSEHCTFSGCPCQRKGTAELKDSTKDRDVAAKWFKRGDA